MLCVVISQEVAEPIVMLLHSHDVPVGLHQLPVGFRLVVVLDNRWTVHLRMAREVARRRLRLLSAPMLDDLVILEPEQVEGDQRTRRSRESLIPGMEQHEVSVHQRTKDCYVGPRRARYCYGK